MRETTSLGVGPSERGAMIGLQSQIERSLFISVLSAERRHDVWKNTPGSASDHPCRMLSRAYLESAFTSALCFSVENGRGRAGTPATLPRSGTSDVTTDPAATIALRPIRIPGSTTQ